MPNYAPPTDPRDANPLYSGNNFQNLPPQPKVSWPVVLFSKVTLPLGALDRTVAAGENQKLRNTQRGPMWVDGVRFNIVQSADEFMENISGIGSAVRLKLSVGRTVLVPSYMPLWLLRTQTTDIEKSNMVFANSQFPIFTKIDWRFRKPFWIPRGAVFQPLFQYGGTLPVAPAVDPPSVDLEVMFYGRTIPEGTPPPELSHVPWATSWLPDPKEWGDPDTLFPESAQPDLSNPFDESLHLDRISGRILLDQFEGSNDAGVAGQPYMGDRLRCSIMDSNGTAIVRDPTAFSHLFSQPSRSWRMGEDGEAPVILRPKGYYKAQVEADLEGAELLDTSRVQPQVALLGYRDVPSSMIEDR